MLNYTCNLQCLKITGDIVKHLVYRCLSDPGPRKIDA